MTNVPQKISTLRSLEPVLVTPGLAKINFVDVIQLRILN